MAAIDKRQTITIAQVVGLSQVLAGKANTSDIDAGGGGDAALPKLQDQTVLAAPPGGGEAQETGLGPHLSIDDGSLLLTGDWTAKYIIQSQPEAHRRAKAEGHVQELLYGTQPEFLVNAQAIGDLPSGYLRGEAGTGVISSAPTIPASDIAGTIPPAALPTHAGTHTRVGSDPLDVRALDGFPGGTATFLRADGIFAAPPTGSGSLLQYDFSSATTEPPTSNQVRFNAGHPYTAVTKVWVRPQTTDGIDAYRYLLALATGTRLVIQDKNDHSLYVTYTLTASPIDKTSYVEFPVAWGSNGGALLNNQAVLLAVAASTTVPAHHSTHEPGGSDAITALSASILTTGALPDARLSSNVARRDQANTFTADQRIESSRSALDYSTAGQTVRSRVGKFGSEAQFVTINADWNAGNWTRDDTAKKAAILRLNADDLTLFPWPVGGNYAEQFRVSSSGRIYERGRAVAMGEWQAMPYSSSNFTSPQGGTWTVGSGIYYRYTLIGSTMIVNIIDDGSTLNVPASTVQAVRIALPAGLSAPWSGRALVQLYVAPSWELGWCNVPYSGTAIDVYRNGYAYFPGGSYTIGMNFQIAFAIP